MKRTPASARTRSFLGFTVAAVLTLIAVWILGRGSIVLNQPDRTRSGFVPAHKERQEVNPQMGYRLKNSSWGEADPQAFDPRPELESGLSDPPPPLDGLDVAFLKPGR